MSSYKNLAIINPAQGSAVLTPDAYGSCALFGKAGVIKDQNPVFDTCVGSHMLNPNLIHLLRVPFGAGKKFLQMLPISSGQRSANFRSCFPACAGQKSRGIALQGVPTFRSAQESTKRNQELLKIYQRFLPCLQNSHLPLLL